MCANKAQSSWSEVNGRHFYEDGAGEEGSLLVERRECVRTAVGRWMVNKRELEMEMNVSQHPRVY